MAKKFKKFLAMALSFSMLFTLFTTPMITASAESTDLKFGSDGKFKIVIFSDIQENASDAYGIQRLNSIMEQAIEYENPDLVVLLGDNTEMNIKDPATDETFIGLVEDILSPIVEANVPYALVFGNHDNQSYYSGQRADKEAMLAVYQAIGDCRTVDADPSIFGTGTCKIPIYDSTGSDVAFDLFMVDSNTYQDPITGSGGYDNPHADQLAWMAANKDAGVNSLVFQHIPMPEAYNFLVQDENGTKTYGGVKYAKQLNELASGNLGEFPCPPNAGDNTGEFAALKAMGGVLGVFTGHDHLNDYTGTLEGINMTAVPGMTYYNYGDEAVRGYGVIELDESDLTTYDYHTVKFTAMDALTSPYALNVDFQGGNNIETSGNATAISNTGSTVTYKFDSTLNRTVASFDGTSGYGYTLSQIARDKMNDGYTYEILYKIAEEPGSNGVHLASSVNNDSGFQLLYTTESNYKFQFRQSFEGDSKAKRSLWYYGDSAATDTWIHLVAVWDKDNNRFTGYLNGVEKDHTKPDSSYTGNLTFDENSAFYIGGNSDSSGNFTSGMPADIAFVRIYDKASSASEVADLYTAALTPGAGASDGTYYPYDEITYGDLMKNNVSLPADGFVFNGGNVLTYDAHSPSYSAKLKFRWTVGADTGIQFSFDKSGNSSMTYPFGVWVKKSNNNSAGANGAWHLKPTDGNLLVNMTSKPSQGDTFDIELGRLKVLETDAQHGGQYYVYLKVDDVLIQSTYVTIDASGNYSSGGETCHLSNEIVFDDWSSYGNKISASPEAETFCDYDVVTYYDLLWQSNSQPLSDSGIPMNGNPKLKYNRTSDTYSLILKYRWTPGSYTIKEDGSIKPWFVFYFDNWSGGAYPYALAVKSPGYSGLGAAAGTNGAWHIDPSNKDNIVQMDTPIVPGNHYDIEHARIKVATGPNAGKYYVYLKVNNELIFSYYYDGDNGNGTYGSKNQAYDSNYLQFTDGTADSYISAIPDDVYDDYDEVYYSNLLDNGNAVGTETQVNNKMFTYNKTSAYGSAVLKYRWKAANTGSSFYVSFDSVPRTDDATRGAAIYNFGALYSASANTIWLRIGNGSAKALAEPLTSGADYDIEFARIKIIGGHNTGKYLFYIKLSDTEGNTVFYDEKYIEASFVDSNGNYTSNTDGIGSGAACSINNTILINFWGNGGGNKITNPAYTETYCDYDEVTYNDLLLNGNPLSASRTALNGNPTFAYNRTSDTYSLILKYRWTPGSYTIKEDGSIKPWFVFYFDNWSGNAYPFALAVKSPNYSGLGAAAGANGAWHLVPNNASSIVQMDTPIVAGQNYDIEHARLKVATGPNAGKYYVYVKVNDQLIYGYYYDGDNGDGTYGPSGKTQAYNSNYLRFTDGTSDSYISAIPIEETYEDYDEIGYSDLMSGGNALPANGTDLSGGTLFTYNRTSATGSAIIKYRWKIGNKPTFQMSFEHSVNNNSSNEMAYLFGAWLQEAEQNTYPNGKMYLRPSYGPQENLPAALTPGTSHNIEFARLKVKTGYNKGKYLVYIKIDDVLVAQDYVSANLIDSSYNYTTKPYETNTSVLSGEIFLAFFNNPGNAISAYKVAVNGHVGIRGDFDDTGTFAASDLVDLAKVMLGKYDGELPEGLADFNNDGLVNVKDLAALKKQIAPVNSYSKSGSLTIGTQEHLLEDETKTAGYIAEASAVLGAAAYRLSKSINTLFYATSTNGVNINTSNMNALKEQVAALKAQGINEILYVTDAYVIPYGYGNSSVCHNKTVPDPIDDKENYEAWLTVNSNAFAALATEVPEIRYFEPFNEINVDGNRLETYGIGWNATAQEQAAHRFTTAEKAGIMADLCWNVSTAVKAVNPDNRVTSPSISVSQASVVDNTFLEVFYTAIESGAYPRNQSLGDIRIDNFFSIINIHSYPDYSDTITAALTNNWAARISNLYNNVIKQHNDGGSRVWISETGISSYHGDGASRNETKCATVLENALNKINSDLTFIDSVFLYKVADISTDVGQTLVESGYGLFYSGDDLDNPYVAKPSAKAVYRFTHGGSTDYTALNNLTAKYDN